MGHVLGRLSPFGFPDCSKFLTPTAGVRKDQKAQEQELQRWVKKGQCRLDVTRSQLATPLALIHAARN